MQDTKKEKKQYEVKLTVKNAVKLDPSTPIPWDGSGQSFYVSKNSKKYIPFLGNNDNFASILLEARLTSSSQNSCINTIVASTIGKGLSLVDEASPDKGFMDWMKNVNNHRKSLNRVLGNVLDGERTQGNQFIEIVRGEISGKKFLKIYPHSLLYCRLSEYGKEGYSESVIISKEFAKKGYGTWKDGVEIPLWNENELDKKKVWVKGADGTERTMLHFKNDVTGVDDYGLPASISGLRYQVLEGKYAQTNIDNLDNNMILGGMLIFKSAMTQEEAEANAREILLSHVGDGKTGRIAVLSSENGAADVQFIAYNTSKEGSYLDTDKRNEEKIWKANGCMALMSIVTGTGLGTGGDHIRSIWDTVETSLLKPLRKNLTDDVVNPILKIYADWFGVKEVADYKVEFQSDMPYSFMSDIDPETFMKVKEARQLARLEPDDANGEKYLSEMKGSKNAKDVQIKPATT